MHFFPTISAEELPKGLETAGNIKSFLSGGRDGFDSLLSSFISEDRTDYSGNPSGFAALEENSGTLGNDRLELFKKALLRRDVSQESIQGLEQYVQSGAPMTIARAFSVLSGGGRRSDPLEDKERDAFRMLLGKIGLSRDETDRMLDLSDDGNGQQLLRGIAAGLKKLDGPVDIGKEEFAAMLRGLDLPEETRQKSLRLFGEKDTLLLAGQELEALLADAGNHFALRDRDALFAKAHMRAAMQEALEAAKARERASPVDDMRGNRRSEQTQAFMEDSVLRKTGADRIKREFGGEEEAFYEDGRNHARRGFLAETQARFRDRAGDRGRSEETPAREMFRRLDTAFSSVAAQANAVQARNLDKAAETYGRAIFSQVEQGIVQNAKNGSQRITLQLVPEDLGRITLVLSMHQGELKAAVLAENQESATLLGAQMTELKASLEEQGIRVSELEVRAELRDDRTAQQWDGHQEHNRMNDARERDRMARLSRMRRERATETEPVAAARTALSAETTGLHIVA